MLNNHPASSTASYRVLSPTLSHTRVTHTFETKRDIVVSLVNKYTWYQALNYGLTTVALEDFLQLGLGRPRVQPAHEQCGDAARSKGAPLLSW